MSQTTAAEVNRGRIYSRLEVTVDCAIHSLGLIAGIAGGAVLIATAAMHGGGEVAVAVVYIAGLLSMFTCSGVYNLWRTSKWRNLLQGLDHSAIFLMIAGTYTPFCVLLLRGAWSVAMTALVWSVAVAGITIRLWFPALFMKTSLFLYLALGWSGVVALGPFDLTLDGEIFALLIAGGLLYMTGIVFHLWTHLPFQNAIWHGFVLAGACLHYFAVIDGIVIASEQLQGGLVLPS